MAVNLYKKGDTHISRGVVCEMKTFPIKYMDTALKSGFVADLRDLEEKPKPAKPSKKGSQQKELLG